MRRLLIIFFLMVSVLTGGFLYLKQIPIRITPLPYTFKYQVKVPEEISEANILIVGDRLGKSLENFNKELTNKISMNLSKPLKIYNWSKKGEGAHRTLYKLKKLKKIPSIVIYFGASEEFHEKRFEITNKDKIFKNFTIFKDEIKLTAITIFPYLSKLIYNFEQIVPIYEEIKFEKTDWNLEKITSQKELLYKIFAQETLEIMQYSLENDFHLLTIIPPLNLEVPVQRVCPTTTGTQIETEQQVISKLLRIGNNNEAYNSALILSDQSPYNARSHYLLGISAKKIGNLKKAISSLEKATIFDCDLWRGTPILNIILNQNVKKTGVDSINFDKILQNQFNKNILFFDEIYPQHLFYEKIVKIIKEKIKRKLNI